MKALSKFELGFQKMAASKMPEWAANAHKTIDFKKSMPTYSKKGVSLMWKRRNVKS